MASPNAGNSGLGLQGRKVSLAPTGPLCGTTLIPTDRMVPFYSLLSIGIILDYSDFCRLTANKEWEEYMLRRSRSRRSIPLDRRPQDSIRECGLSLNELSSNRVSNPQLSRFVRGERPSPSSRGEAGLVLRIGVARVKPTK